MAQRGLPVPGARCKRGSSIVMGKRDSMSLWVLHPCFLVQPLRCRLSWELLDADSNRPTGAPLVHRITLYQLPWLFVVGLQEAPPMWPRNQCSARQGLHGYLFIHNGCSGGTPLCLGALRCQGGPGHLHSKLPQLSKHLCLNKNVLSGTEKLAVKASA